MATRTTNFGLYKPDPTDDYVDFLSEFNDNMDEIDEHLGSGGSGGVKILRSQSLSFTGLVATVSDSDITADSNYIVYYHDVTLAENAGITTVASSGVITFTATTAPSNTIVVDIVLLDVNGGGGTQGVFAPVIYSDNERCIGVWRDNKPLYQRTYAVTYGTSDNAIQLDFSPEVLMFVSGGTYNKQNSTGNMVSYGFYVSSSNRLQIYYQSNSNSLLVQSVDSYITGTGYVTIRYTKTTDVAGSGNWNTDGVPMVHYSTSEQVIGTWIDGKTIYQRVLTGLSLTTSRGTAYTITIQDHGIAQFIDSICLSTQTQYRTVMHPPTWLSDANTIVIRSEENDTFDTLIIQYTKA